MTIRSTALIACVATGLLTSACSDRATAEAETTASSAPVAIAEAVPPVAAAPAPTLSVQERVAGFAGTYDGPFEGGPGTVTISGSGPTYRAQIIVVGEGGCVAEIDARARTRGDGLTIRETHPDAPDSGVCQITMTRTGDRLALRETSCAAFHGMGCTFTGTAERTQ